MNPRQRPTRSTPDGRAYLDLRALATRQGRRTNELLQLYTLEGFLGRLSRSAHAASLVLKGGVLLAAYNARRPTRDIDMQLRNSPGANDDVLQLVRDVASLELDDGLTFDTATATARTIRDEDEYSGVRVTMAAVLATARIGFHLDVNVGDPIWPAPRHIELPRLLGGTIDIIGYPLPMVYAEKVVTAIQRGRANTRWRDFADIRLLVGRHPISGRELQEALSVVAEHRHVEQLGLAAILSGFSSIGQSRWEAWVRQQDMGERLPLSFDDVIRGVVAFADPALAGAVTNLSWNPATRGWE